MKIYFDRVNILGGRFQEILDPNPSTVMSIDSQGNVSFVSIASLSASGTTYQASTSNATPTNILASSPISIASGKVVMFNALISAIDNLGLAAVWRVSGGIKNYSGTTEIIGTPTVELLAVDQLAEASWGVVDAISISADDGNDRLIINVTGAVGATINWAASLVVVQAG